MFSFFLSRKQCINFLVTSATLKKKKIWELNQPKPNLNWTYAIQLGSILWPDNTTYHVVLLVFPIIIIPCRVHEQKVNIAFCTSFPLGTIWAPLYTHTHTRSFNSQNYNELSSRVSVLFMDNRAPILVSYMNSPYPCT